MPGLCGHGFGDVVTGWFGWGSGYRMPGLSGQGTGDSLTGPCDQDFGDRVTWILGWGFEERETLLSDGGSGYRMTGHPCLCFGQRVTCWPGLESVDLETPGDFAGNVNGFGWPSRGIMCRALVEPLDLPFQLCL